MLTKRVESSYGRFTEKPDTAVANQDEVIIESAIPIQDQIESFKTKISLRARYNTVIQEELEQSEGGASSLLEKLFKETKCLRNGLILALKAESHAVKLGLRSYEKLQWAMEDKIACEAIPWLTDRLFDLKKKFNLEINNLKLERLKILDAEIMITLMEKYPKPGSLPWEIITAIEFEIMETKTSNIKDRFEAATILNSSFRGIKDLLQQDESKVNPLRDSLQQQLSDQKKELTKFKQMLVDAIKFRDEAQVNLTQAEYDGIANKRDRLARMNLVKGKVGNLTDGLKPNEIWISNIFLYNKMVGQKGQKVTSEMYMEILSKIEDAELRTNLILADMHIKGVNRIPYRIKQVLLLGNYLDSQYETVESFCNHLLKQKAVLTATFMESHYTGSEKLEKFQKAKKLFEEQKASIESEQRKLEILMEIEKKEMIEIQLAIITATAHFEHDNKNHHHQAQNHGTPTDPKTVIQDMCSQLKRLGSKLKRLTKQTELIEKSLTELKQQDNPPILKFKPTLRKLVRVKPPPDEIDSEDDDLIDPGVPSAAEIKKAGKKLVQRTLIRRGLH